jgi:hypothetical protein
VFTRGETFRKVKYLWSGDVITASYELAVYIDLRWFGTLQEEVDGLSLPTGGDVNLALIPGTTLI